METKDDASKSNSEDDVKAKEEKQDDPEKAQETQETADSSSVEPTSELLQQIREQVEFYFGDVNMQRDKFLRAQTRLSDGWIPMSVMLRFKMLAALSTDMDVILKALESSELMEISEDRKSIRRSLKHPLPVYDEEYKKAQEARTVYVKGFPLKETTIEELKKFFGSFGPYESVYMRKYQDKEKNLHFKGSVFVQFSTIQTAKEFMEKESIKYGENELIKKWVVDYTLEKLKERDERRLKKSEKKEKINNDKEDSKEEEQETENDSGLPKGSILHISGMLPDCTRENIKETLIEAGAVVAFIDFKKGDSKGWVRLQGEDAAKPFVEKMIDSKITISGAEVTCRVLEGDEEKDYLIKVKEEMKNVRQKLNNRGKRGVKKSEL
ncbi:la protein homolog isoform X2 [Orussus abietinus]|uniref:la protein homolog isoform X2 n=1 Tax=Orussus abietinus TaxID=222816 RepID=UPI00062606F9|nr:la protein homolog isoform X2 [Orussus abietinus]